jgi:MFS family permease
MGLNIFAITALLSIFFIQMGIGIITPALQSIVEAFPNIPFTTLMLISTLPSLTMIPASIAAGVMAEKYGYRLINILGALFFVIGGTLPFLQDNFNMILVSLGIFGLGLGILFPMGNALVLKFYEGQKRANMMGLSGIAANIGGISMQMGGAFLCAIYWKNTFLMHLIGLITLVCLIFFLPEPPKAPVQESSSKVKLPAMVWTISILCCFIQMINCPMLLNMSTIIISSKLGTAASAGIVLSMFTVGGMIGGAIFGKVFQITGRFVIAIGIAVMGLGLGIINFAPSLVLLGCGTTVVGIGLFIFIPGCMMDLGKYVAPAGIGMATGIFMALANIGLFLTPYYMSMLAKISGNADTRFPILAGTILAFATALLVGVSRVKPEPVAEAQH